MKAVCYNQLNYDKIQHRSIVKRASQTIITCKKSSLGETPPPCKITVSHGENKEERRELIKRIFLFCFLTLQGDKKLIRLHLAFYF